MARVSVCVVNLNCLQDTKELILDLDRQTYPDFEVTLYDQGSTEVGTTEFLDTLSLRGNYTVIQNGDNKPLNHIWNEFAQHADSEFISLLNNDIRTTSNYFEDTVNVLDNDKRVGIAIHATNNRRYSTATRPTRHIFESTRIKQGWEFTLRKDDWVPIPEALKFYCGDDFIYDQMYKNGKKIGVITSSPVLHKLSKTRKNMDKASSDKIRAQAMTDIETYKSLGFTHTWNNITKHSRIEPEFNVITEVSTEINLCKFVEYQKRLGEHLLDSMGVDGVILDLGVNNAPTFDVMLDHAMEYDKQLVGIDIVESISGAVVANTSTTRPAELIRKNEVALTKTDYFTIHNNGFSEDVDEFDDPISFAFVGIFNPVKLRLTLPKLWANIQPGGTLFFPYYYYNTCPAIAHVVDTYFEDKTKQIIKSRRQTLKGNRDTYLAIKCFTVPLPVPKRDKPLTIACVLKVNNNKATSQGIYDETYVNRLATAVQRHTTVDYRFVCMTDVDPDGIDMSAVDEVIPLEYGLDGWWSKFELFRPDVFDGAQVLYFDLDTLITDNIDDIANYGGDFLALRDLNTLISVSSGILSWDSTKTDHMFYRFIRELISGDITIKQFYGGDQEAIEHLMELPIDWIQDLFPNKLCAFKYECVDPETDEIFVPDGCSMICFHGLPKMADLDDDPVIQAHWYD